MKWLIAPDSFKNCLRSPQVAAQLAAGIRDISPDDEIIELPWPTAAKEPPKPRRALRAARSKAFR